MLAVYLSTGKASSDANMDAKRNLVLGTATSYDVDYIKNNVIPFVNSFKRNVFDADLVIIVSSTESPTVLQFLTNQNISFFQFPFEGKKGYVERYNAYKEYLRKNKKYERVLVTDTRDVLFQKSPFKQLNDIIGDEHGVVFILEGNVGKGIAIETCKYNSNWIQSCFNATVYSYTKDKYISCSGSTIGDSVSLLQYFELLSMIFSSVIDRTCENMTGIDQGAHNYLLYYYRNFIGLPFKAIPMEVGTSPIGTIGYTDSWEYMLDQSGFLVFKNYQIPSVVHQYDRKEEKFIKDFRDKYNYSD